MDIPTQISILSIPSLIYIVILRRQRFNWRRVLERVGGHSCQSLYYLWGLVTLLILGLSGWFAISLIPREIIQDPRISLSMYAGWKLNASAFLSVLVGKAIFVAFGEEIFFRGLIGGWLTDRFGLANGNTIQALFYVLPYFLLFTVSLHVWPLILIQFVAGWLFGWLRYASGSIIPGWIAHCLTYALGALAVMA